MGGWIDEVLALLRAEPDWDEWDLISIPYNGKNGFDVQPLFVRTLNKPGPIVVLEKVQSGPLANLREKLGGSSRDSTDSGCRPGRYLDGSRESSTASRSR